MFMTFSWSEYAFLRGPRGWLGVELGVPHPERVGYEFGREIDRLAPRVGDEIAVVAERPIRRHRALHALFGNQNFRVVRSSRRALAGVLGSAGRGLVSYVVRRVAAAVLLGQTIDQLLLDGRLASGIGDMVA